MLPEGVILQPSRVSPDRASRQGSLVPRIPSLSVVGAADEEQGQLVQPEGDIPAPPAAVHPTTSSKAVRLLASQTLLRTRRCSAIYSSSDDESSSNSEGEGGKKKKNTERRATVSAGSASEREDDLVQLLEEHLAASDGEAASASTLPAAVSQLELSADGGDHEQEERLASPEVRPMTVCPAQRADVYVCRPQRWTATWRGGAVTSH